MKNIIFFGIILIHLQKVGAEMLSLRINEILEQQGKTPKTTSVKFAMAKLPQSDLILLRKYALLLIVPLTIYLPLMTPN